MTPMWLINWKIGRHLKKGHFAEISRVTVPLFDPSARGLLIRCDCGKVWAY